MSSTRLPYEDHAPLELSPQHRLGVLAFGAFAYLAFLVAFLYLIAFLADAWVPFGIDSGRRSPALWAALAIDLGLITLFALQHSLMARSGFKAWLKTQVTPATERSFYVLASSAVLALLCWLWQPLPQRLWQLDAGLPTTLAWAAFGAGILIVLISTFLIDHFDLFGLRQSWTAFVGRRSVEPEFRTPWFYRIVRHPLYVGWIVTFFATPTMSVGHLLFAVTMTLYMLVAIRFEERDLIRKHGETYVEYRERVPMLVPKLSAQARR
jgi:protein-S-isoprenylcysteine O-methyltransferase Ste14